MTKNSPSNQLKYCLQTAEARLDESAIPSSRLDSELLMCFVIGKSRIWVITNPEFNLSKLQVNKFFKLINQRSVFYPVAYLTNNKEFFGRDFYVDENVLIPRPETEDLVELVLDNTDSSPKSVLDLGTGSGVIGITLALQRPNWRLTLSDISEEALTIAKINAKKLKVFDKKQFVVADMIPPKTEFDIICANLPYVPTSFNRNKDISFEPPISLYSGDDGLAHYRSLFDTLSQNNHRPELLAIESLEISQPELIKIARTHNFQLKESKRLSLLFELI